jgi:tol-pal system protein YbgF
MKGTKTILWVALASAGSACSTYSPTEDPVALKLTDLEARLIRIERVLDNQSLVELAAELTRIREDSQSLRGEIETLRFETENAATRQRELYLDVDSRLQALEQSQSRLSGAVGSQSPMTSGAAAGLAASGVIPGGQAGGIVVTGASGDQDSYQAAFELLRTSRYEQAATAFSDFLTNHSNSPLADNAQYWLAETFYVRRDFQQALPEFQKVLDLYPQSAKIPDALLKIGFSQDELRRPEEARAALLRVTREYPDTTAARLATQRLERLGRGG